jgi:hypothetical protein
MKRTPIVAGMFLVLLALVAYAKPNVIVVDSEGKPIKGASVEQITLSMNLASKLTDKDGKVEIPKGAIQKTEWISVTKSGYVSSGHIKFDQPKPIKVILKLEPKKAGEQGGGGQPATRPGSK